MIDGFCIRLMLAREKNGLDQTELAKLIGVYPGVVNRWENGKYVPQCAYLVRLAKVLRVSTDYLLGVNHG